MLQAGYAQFSTFSDITFVFELTFWFTANLQIIIHSSIRYQFETYLRSFTCADNAFLAKSIIFL